MMFTNQVKRIAVIAAAVIIVVLLFVFTPLKNIFNGVLTPLERGAWGISQHMRPSGDASETEKLEQQLHDLTVENQKMKALNEENKHLRALLAMQERYTDIPTVGAQIVAKDAGNWFSVFSLNVGKKQNIRKNFPVVNEDGLVGRTVEVGRNWSKVVSMIDTSHAMTAEIARTGDLVMIEGDLTLMKSGLCKMTVISEGADVIVGDIVETSGIGGVYPKGILVGTVQEFREDEAGKGNYAIVKPAADLQRISEVFVMQMPEDWVFDFSEDTTEDSSTSENEAQ